MSLNILLLHSFRVCHQVFDIQSMCLSTSYKDALKHDMVNPLAIMEQSTQTPGPCQPLIGRIIPGQYCVPTPTS